MKCDKCNKNEANIILNSTDNLCIDCYNRIASRWIGIEDIKEYNKDIYIYDSDGVLRQFSIYYMILGEKISWVMKEVDGEYEFSVLEDAHCDQARAINKLHLKAINGVDCQVKLTTFYK